MSKRFLISEEEKMINFVNGFLEIHNLFLVPFTMINPNTGDVIQTNFVMEKQEGFSYTYVPIEVGEGSYKVLCSYEHLIPTFYNTSEGRKYFPSQNESYKNIAKYANQKLFRNVNLNIGWKSRNSLLNILTKNFNLSRYLFNHELVEFNEFIFHSGFSFTYKKGLGKRVFSARFALSKRTLRMSSLGNSASSMLWCPAHSSDNLLEKYPDVIILDTESQITEFLNIFYRAFNIECSSEIIIGNNFEGYKEIFCKMKDREMMLKIPIWLINLVVSK
jgi:hypothetical protein